MAERVTIDVGEIDLSTETKRDALLAGMDLGSCAAVLGMGSHPQNPMLVRACVAPALRQLAEGLGWQVDSEDDARGFVRLSFGRAEPADQGAGVVASQSGGPDATQRIHCASAVGAALLVLGAIVGWLLLGGAF